MADDHLSRAFAALADPTRRELVARLTIGDATISDLAAPFAMSLQAVSKHVTVLESAGLVSRQGSGRRRPVHLETEALAAMTDWIDTHAGRAERRLGRLEATLSAPPPGPRPQGADR